MVDETGGATCVQNRLMCGDQNQVVLLPAGGRLIREPQAADGDIQSHWVPVENGGVSRRFQREELCAGIETQN